MRCVLSYFYNNKSHQVIITGQCSNKCLEKGFEHLESIGVLEAEIEVLDDTSKI